MRTDRLAGLASMALGIGIAAVALLGPLWLGKIRQHVSANVENQVVGADAISLLLVAPLAVLGGLLWWRGHPLASSLTFGPAAYAVYIHFQYMVGSEYERYPGNSERYFVLFYAIVMLGLLVSTLSWSQLSTPALPSRRVQVLAAGLLIGVSALLGLAWITAIADVIGGTRTTEYLEAPGLFWMVKTMDLAFVIPAALATGVGLLRHSALAARVAAGLTCWLALMMASVAAMGAVMWRNDDPSASPRFVVVLAPVAAIMAVLTTTLWRTRGASPNGTPDLAHQHRPERMPQLRGRG
ncbi:MAG: hypothetical protein M9890_00515 [Thermomicrobiales bacterium]|nr:hypothetical protein [Thermomicrobiales bacterium]